VTPEVLAVVASIAALSMSGLLALVPVRHCRVVALVGTFTLICVFASNTAPTYLWSAVALGGPVLLAVAWYRTGLVVRHVGAAMGTATVFLVVIMLSSLLSGGGLPSFVPLSAALGWTATQLDEREGTVVARAVIAVGVAEAVYAAAQAFLGVRPLWGIVASQGTENPFVETLDRAQASLGQAIVYGFFAASTAFLAWSNAARLPRPLHVSAFVVLAGGLFLSGTRSAAVALLAAITVHALLRPGLVPWVRNLGATLMAVALVGLLDFGVRGITVEALQSGSWLQRLGSLTSAPRLLRRSGLDFWLGSGFGSEQELYRVGLLRSPYHFTVVDNFYVYVLGTMGLVGLVLLLALLVVAFARSSRTGRGTVLVVVVMCAAFDLLVWRSSAAVFVLFLVLEPSVGRMRRKTTPDEAAGEADVARPVPLVRPITPGTRTFHVHPGTSGSPAAPCPSSPATLRSHQIAEPGAARLDAGRLHGRRRATSPHENLEESSREAPS
jgi:hypothetical protein